MLDLCIENEIYRHQGGDAQQVRLSQFVGLQLQKYLCDDGIEAIPVQSALQITPLEHMYGHTPLQVAYGGEKEVCKEQSAETAPVSNQQARSESSRSALVTSIACVSALTVLALIVSLAYTQQDNKAHMSPRFVLLYRLGSRINKLNIE